MVRRHGDGDHPLAQRRRRRPAAPQPDTARFVEEVKHAPNLRGDGREKPARPWRRWRRRARGGKPRAATATRSHDRVRRHTVRAVGESCLEEQPEGRWRSERASAGADDRTSRLERVLRKPGSRGARTPPRSLARAGRRPRAAAPRSVGAAAHTRIPYAVRSDGTLGRRFPWMVGQPCFYGRPIGTLFEAGFVTCQATTDIQQQIRKRSTDHPTEPIGTLLRLGLRGGTTSSSGKNIAS